MKEIRVYVVNCDLYDGEEYIPEMTNEQFMVIAEDQGGVYSLKGFERDYNEEYIGSASTFIRFIEVECAESINFEEWNIPSVKLNEQSEEGKTMETKEFAREQLDVLADMVLAEMGRLREFSNGRSEVVRESLSDEIVRLHTLYNYLIA